MSKEKTPSKRKIAVKPKKRAVLTSKTLEEREREIRAVFDGYNTKINELKKRRREIIKNFIRKAGQKKMELIRKNIGLK